MVNVSLDSLIAITFDHLMPSGHLFWHLSKSWDFTPFSGLPLASWCDNLPCHTPGTSQCVVLDGWLVNWASSSLMDWSAMKEYKHLEIHDNYFVPPQSNRPVKAIVPPKSNQPVKAIVPLHPITYVYGLVCRICAAHHMKRVESSTS